eukprot:sb/3475863/
MFRRQLSVLLVSGVPFDSKKHGQDLESLLQPKVFESLLTPISLYSTKITTPLHLSYLAISGLDTLPTPGAFFSSLSTILPTSPLLGSGTRYSYSGESIPLPELFPQFFGAKVLENGNFVCDQ